MLFAKKRRLSDSGSDLRMNKVYIQERNISNFLSYSSNGNNTNERMTESQTERMEVSPSKKRISVPRTPQCGLVNQSVSLPVEKMVTNELQFCPLCAAGQGGHIGHIKR